MPSLLLRSQKKLRRKSRRNMLMPFWTRFESLVRRVIMVFVPSASLSLSESEEICLKSALLIFSENPVAALAAKY